MKKSRLVLLITVFIVFESCNDNFNINAPQEDIYILNCILRNDQSIQYAIISKNIYTENGASPASNISNQNIKDADIEIFYNDSVFIMRDTTIQLSESENVTPISCYYVKNLTISSGRTIRIEASVPGGKKLGSIIQGLQIYFSKVSVNFPPKYNPDNENRYYYGWTWRSNSGLAIKVLNLPELEICYKKYEAGNFVDKTILVPLANYYVQNKDESFQPVNIDQLSNIISCSITSETVDSTMRKISGDDPDKKNYIINKISFRVIGLDPELEKYYFAYKTYEEGFSIKLRQTDYSNINGGKGIFGAYYKFTKSLIIDSSYVTSFGYQYDPL